MTLRRHKRGTTLARSAVVQLDAAGVPPRQIRIFKFGRVRTTKGTFIFDEKAAKSVFEAWTDYGNDLCFDYEHKAVDKDGAAGDGLAAGWFKLAVKDDGLYAVDIKWTSRAAKEIAAKEWRYFSPAFDFEHKSGRILELINVALTNIPATKNLPALIAAARSKHMALKKKTAKKTARKATTDKNKKVKAAALKKTTKKTVTETTEDEVADEETDESEDSKLDEEESDEEEDDEEEDDEAEDDESEDDEEDSDEGDDDEGDDDDSDADDDDDDAPPAKKKAPPPPAKKSKKMSTGKLSRGHRTLLASVLDLTGTDDPEEALGALQALKGANAEVTKLSRVVGRMQLDGRKTAVKASVESAIKCGKLIPAQRKQFVELGMKSPKRLKGMLDIMPKRVHMEGDEAHEDLAATTTSRAGGIDTVSLGRTGLSALPPLERRDIELIQKKLGVDFAAMAKAGSFLPLSKFLEAPDDN